jgi:hypothetical protein
MQAKHRRFWLVRDRDHTGLRYIGTIAEGIRWGDGTVALRWLSDTPSTTVWTDIESMLAVHGHDAHIEWDEVP